MTQRARGSANAPLPLPLPPSRAPALVASCQSRRSRATVLRPCPHRRRRYELQRPRRRHRPRAGSLWPRPRRFLRARRRVRRPSWSLCRSTRCALGCLLRCCQSPLHAAKRAAKAAAARTAAARAATSSSWYRSCSRHVSAPRATRHRCTPRSSAGATCSWAAARASAAQRGRRHERLCLGGCARRPMCLQLRVTRACTRRCSGAGRATRGVSSARQPPVGARPRTRSGGATARPRSPRSTSTHARCLQPSCVRALRASTCTGHACASSGARSLRWLGGTASFFAAVAGAPVRACQCVQAADRACLTLAMADAVRSRFPPRPHAAH